MKVSIKSFVTLCAIYFLASGLAFAQAEVSVDGQCRVLNEEGTAGVPELDDADMLSISAHNVNNNITITCSRELPPTISGRTVVHSFDSTGLVCKVPGVGVTKDWHQVMTRNGKTKLTCHYKQ